MSGDTIFLLIVSVFLVSVLINQLAKRAQIKVYETQRNNLKTVNILAAFFLLVFGFFVGNNILHYLISILASLIFFLSLYATGLTETGIVYTPRMGGLAGLNPKRVGFENIKGINKKQMKNYIVMEFVADYTN